MSTTMKRLLGMGVCLSLALAMPSVVLGQAQHARWDITSVDFTTTPFTVNPGGFADAIAPNNGGKIRLSGSGTFVAPAGGGRSGSARGGGAWETFDSANVSTGGGSYTVTDLVRFQQANFQTPGSIIDNIGDQSEASNGNAYLRIEFDDGSHGVLGVFCHGPGAPDGIAEGINVTKGFVTYTEVQEPAPLVDLNRTLFHVRRR